MDNIPPEGTGRVNDVPGSERPGDRPFTPKPGLYKDKKVTETATRRSGSTFGHHVKGRTLAQRKGKVTPGQTILNPSGSKDAASLAEHSVEKLNNMAHMLMGEIRGSQKSSMFSSAGEGVGNLLQALDNKDETDRVSRGLAGLKLPGGIHVEIIRNGRAVSIIPPAKSLQDCTVKELRFYCSLCLKVIRQESGNDPLSIADHQSNIEQARERLLDVHHQLVGKAGASDISGQLEQLDSEPCSHSVDLKKEDIEQLVPEKYRSIASDCIIKLEAHARKNTTASQPDPRPERRMPREEKERVSQQRKKAFSEDNPPLMPSADRVRPAEPENLGESEAKRELEARIQVLEAENCRLKDWGVELKNDKTELLEINREQQRYIENLSNVRQQLLEENKHLEEMRRAELSEMNLEKRKSNNRLENRLAEQERANNELRVQNHRLGQSLEKEIHQLKNCVNELSDVNRAQDKQIHDLGRERERLLEKNRELEESRMAAIQEMKWENSSITQDRQWLEKENQQLEETLQENREHIHGLEYRLAEQRHEIDQLVAQNQRLGQSGDAAVDSYSELKRKLAELEKANGVLINEQRQLRGSNQELSEQAQRLQGDVQARDLLEQENRELIKSNQSMASQNKALEQAAQVQQESERAGAEKIKQLLEENAKLVSQVAQMAKKGGGGASTPTKVETDKVKELNSKIERLEQNIERIGAKNKALIEEKDEALNRLSKLAGDKLIDNNPGIADLRDPNRPMKLGEQFSQIYDDEWTNALEELIQ
ncbi:MAG: hypothetical protein ACPG5T_01680, partial [Endozoicomonas sp.]